MTHISKCEHGVYMALCRKCFPGQVDVEFNKDDYCSPQLKTLTDEEISDFIHRMVLCCQVHPSSADINVLGLKFIVEDILRKASEK